MTKIMKENLTTKNIKDFKPGDSLYVRVSNRYGPSTTAEVKFISFEKGRVKGQVVAAEPNPELFESKIKSGWEVDERLSACALYGIMESNGETRKSFHYFDPIGYAIYDSPQERFMKVPEEHPTYGMLSLHKHHCSSAQPYFGAATLQSDTFAIKISTASLKRDLNSDYISPGKTLVEIHLTPQQFTDFLTSSGSCGTPVTLYQVMGEDTGDTPFVSKLEQFDSEFRSSVAKVGQTCELSAKKIKEILKADKPISKKDREFIARELDGLNMQIESNLPFVSEQFTEQMDKVVLEAKSSINAFLHKQAAELGLPPQSPHTLNLLSES